MVSKQRSYIMSKIKSKNTIGEQKLFKALKFLGLPVERWGNVFGKPDFLLSESKIAVFMDGCFWHCHDTHFKLPKTRRAFWKAKFKRNKQRDAEVNNFLTANGYTVFRFWDCEVQRKPLFYAAQVRHAYHGVDPISAR